MGLVFKNIANDRKEGRLLLGIKKRGGGWSEINVLNGYKSVKAGRLT